MMTVHDEPCVVGLQQRAPHSPCIALLVPDLHDVIDAIRASFAEFGDAARASERRMGVGGTRAAR